MTTDEVSAIVTTLSVALGFAAGVWIASVTKKP